MHHFSYIDPGSGSLFVQVIVGGAFAFMFAMRRFFRVGIVKIKHAFGRKPAAADEEN